MICIDLFSLLMLARLMHLTFYKWFVIALLSFLKEWVNFSLQRRHTTCDSSVLIMTASSKYFQTKTVLILPHWIFCRSFKFCDLKRLIIAYVIVFHQFKNSSRWDSEKILQRLLSLINISSSKSVFRPAVEKETALDWDMIER